MREHADDRDKYFVTDMVKETPEDLGFEPESKAPPEDGYVGWMPWWKHDRRYPKPRVLLENDPKLAEKIISSESEAKDKE